MITISLLRTEHRRVEALTLASSQRALLLTFFLLLGMLGTPSSALAIVVRVKADAAFEHQTGTIAIMPADCRLSINCAAIDKIVETYINSVRKTGPVVSAYVVGQAIKSQEGEFGPAAFDAAMAKLGADTMIFPTISSYGPVEDHRVARIMGRPLLGSARPLSMPTVTIYAISKKRHLVMMGWATGDSIWRSDGNIFSRLMDAFSAHAFNGQYEPVYAAAPAQAETPKAEAATSAAASSVVTSAGTGFIVRPDGYILTSNHVVRGASAIFVSCSGQDRSEAKLVGSSRRTDLALLQVGRRTPDYMTLAPIRSGNLGDPVFTVGFPVTDLLGRDPKFTDGTISALSGFDDEKSFLQISVPIQPGNSGGPLVNDRGEVLGIVAATAAIELFYRSTEALPQNVNFAVKGEYARVLYDTPPPRPPTSTRREAIARVQSALCYVEALQ